MADAPSPKGVLSCLPMPLRMMAPNAVTLLAIGAGLTAVRWAIEGHIEYSLAGIIVAAILDGVDGRVARLLKGESHFGEELDSLADFVNFGVAPALILYFWQLHELGNGGWLVTIVFALSDSLRLARFNSTINDTNRPPFAANFSTGVPAPAGAICVFLPVYLHLVGFPRFPPLVTAIYAIVIAVLMVSRVQVFSGKMLGTQAMPRTVAPLVMFLVALFAALFVYTWQVMTIGTFVYLGCVPVSWLSFRRQVRNLQARELLAKLAASPSSAYSQ